MVAGGRLIPRAPLAVASGAPLYCARDDREKTETRSRRLRIRDLDDDQAGEKPGESEVGDVYGGVDTGEAPPVPVGEIGNNARRQAHDGKKSDAPGVGAPAGLQK